MWQRRAVIYSGRKLKANHTWKIMSSKWKFRPWDYFYPLLITHPIINSFRLLSARPTKEILLIFRVRFSSCVQWGERMKVNMRDAFMIDVTRSRNLNNSDFISIAVLDDKNHFSNLPQGQKDEKNLVLKRREENFIFVFLFASARM